MSLLRKPHYEGMFQRVLIVVDGSAAGVRAAKFSIMVARRTGA